MTTEPRYPECEKWRATADERDTIERFLAYAARNDVYLGMYTPKGTYMTSLGLTEERDVVNGFFGIDQAKLDAERLAIAKRLAK